MEENKVATDSSAPTVPDVTRLSGEQAEERAAREGRAKEWLRGRGIYAEYNVEEMNEDEHKLTDLLTAYAESECSRLASTLARVHDSPHEPDKWEMEVANAIGAKLPATLREEMEQRAIKANEAARLASRVEELENSIRDAMSAAGGRWEEWGGRAMTVREILDKALAGAHAEEKE